jgi:hypothetical protein
MPRVLLSLGFCGLMSATACGGAPAAHAPTSTKIANFDEREDQILHTLAAIDRRIALRARITPSETDLGNVAMGAVLHEDPNLAVIDGTIDPFSFDARARGLETARAQVVELPPSPPGRGPSERELLGRLIDAERARLDEERALPRSASALVRAITDTWQAPRTREEAMTADRWLARRLQTVREAMTAPTDDARALDVVRARELDDALDALERFTSAPGFTTATQELVRVRESLETVASRPAARAHSDWDTIERRLHAHLGLNMSAEDLAKRLAAAEEESRQRAVRAVAATTSNLDALGPSVERHVFTMGPCLDAVPGSRVRSMAAPPEREASCHLRQFVARGDDALGQALALIAMHDAVVVAQWALDVARGTSTVAEAQGRHRLLVPPMPDARARYERIALARPITAIASGETVALLLDGDPKARAAAWAKLGDVPFDIAAKELSRASPR